MSNENILSDIQTRLVVTKAHENKFGGFNYRSAEDILEALKPLLAEHGCSIKMSDEIVLVGDRYYVKAVATLSKGTNVLQSAQAFAREAQEQKGMVAAMVTGSTSSYARKYCLSGLFAIDDNDDPDATSEESLVTDEQIANIETLASEVHADMTGFLKYLKVKTLAELSSNDYAKAIKALESKRAK